MIKENLGEISALAEPAEHASFEVDEKLYKALDEFDFL